MTRLKLLRYSWMAPGPPTSSQVVGAMVDVINSIRLWKSACPPPPKPPGPKAGGCAALAAAMAAPLAELTCASRYELIIALHLEPLMLATTCNGASPPMPPYIGMEF